jgi:hypothetical protein
MGISYLLAPVNDELLAWGHKCNVPVPLDTPHGRVPTHDELIATMRSIADHQVTRNHHDIDFDVTIESFDRIEIETRKPFRNTTAPASYLHARGNISDGANPPWISFHGDIGLILAVTQRLVSRCGPLAFFANCDGKPWFVLSETVGPIGPDKWENAKYQIDARETSAQSSLNAKSSPRSP